MRKSLIGAAAVLAVLGAAVLATPLLVPTEFLKREIAAYALAETGRELRIGGPLRLSLLPNVTLTADDVSLANAPGGAAPNLIEIQRVEARLRLLPLLRGRIEARQLSFVHPRLNLEIDRNGRRNWLFSKPVQPDAGATPAAGSGDVSIAAAHLRIDGGTAGYLDRRGGRQQTVSDIDLTAALPEGDGPLDVQGSAVRNGETMRFAATAASFEELRHRGSEATITIASAPANFSFKGKIALGHGATAAGTANLKSPSLRRLLVWLGVKGQLGGTAPWVLTADGRVELDAKTIAFADATIVFDAVTAKGNLTVDRDGEHPLLKGLFYIDTIDLAPYLGSDDTPPGAGTPPSPAPTSSKASPTPGQAAASAQPSGIPIRLPSLGKYEADLMFSVNSIRFHRIEIGKSFLSAYLNQKDGRWLLDIGEMALYGGQASGDIAVDKNAGSPAFAAKLKLTNVDAGPLLSAVAQTGALTGRGNLAFDLHASGHSTDELMASLAGTGRFDLADGVLTGAVVEPYGAVVPQIENNAKSRAGQLPFSALSASYMISHGILTNSDLKLTSPQMTATGQGFVNLSPCRADYRWAPVVPGKGSAQIAISGPCDDLAYRAMTLTISPPAKKK